MKRSPEAPPSLLRDLNKRYAAVGVKIALAAFTPLVIVILAADLTQRGSVPLVDTLLWSVTKVVLLTLILTISAWLLLVVLQALSDFVIWLRRPKA